MSVNPYQPPARREREEERHPQFRIIEAPKGMNRMSLIAACLLIVSGLTQVYLPTPSGSVWRFPNAVGSLMLAAGLFNLFFPVLRRSSRRRRIESLPEVAHGAALRAGRAWTWHPGSHRRTAGYLVLTRQELVFHPLDPLGGDSLRFPLEAAARSLLKVSQGRLYFRDGAGELVKFDVDNLRVWRECITRVAKGERLH